MKKYPFVYVYLPMFSLAVIILTAYFIYETKFAVKTEKLYGTWELVSSREEYLGSPVDTYIEFSSNNEGKFTFKILNGNINKDIHFKWLPSTGERNFLLNFDKPNGGYESGYFEYEFESDFSILILKNSSNSFTYRKVF